MKYSQVKNCRYSNAEGTAIDCEVLFNDLGWVEFTSSRDDLPHSKEIYVRAQSGEFGAVGTYVPIETNVIEIKIEDTIRNKRNTLLSNLDLTISNPLRWAEFTQEQQTDFARYRQELLNVPQQAGFPSNVTWPNPPMGLVEHKEIPMLIMT
jgi:hypothetical protein